MAGTAPTAGALAQAAPILAPRRAQRYPPFAWVTIGIAAGAAAMLVAAAPAPPLGDLGFWLLAACVLAGELLPIRLPRRDDLEEIALSMPFAFALMLYAGPLPAIAVYAAGSVLHDVLDRTAPLK